MHSITVWNKIQFHTWMYKKGCGKAVCITELCIPTIGHNFLHSSLVKPKKFTKSSSVLPLTQRELYNTELRLQGGGRGQKKTTFPALNKQARIVLLENPDSNCRKKLKTEQYWPKKRINGFVKRYGIKKVIQRKKGRQYLATLFHKLWSYHKLYYLQASVVVMGHHFASNTMTSYISIMGYYSQIRVISTPWQPNDNERLCQ